MDLRHRVALVTGSARRIGREIARDLAGAGADIALHHHSSSEAAGEAADEFRALGVRAELFSADLSRPAEIAALLAAVDEAFGRLDILVNNASLFEQKPVLEITPDDWDRVIDVNLRAPFFCSQGAARLMKRGAGGVIVNIADVAAVQPWPGYATHSISKSALLMMTRVLARALAPDVRVNAIAPGPVLPPDGADSVERERLAGLTALRRVGTPQDVSRAVLFLIESDYMTGETIVVDGGKTLRG